MLRIGGPNGPGPSGSPGARNFYLPTASFAWMSWLTLERTMREADSVDTLNRSEQIEPDLERLITKRHEQRVSEEQGRVEDLWAESVRRPFRNGP